MIMMILTITDHLPHSCAMRGRYDNGKVNQHLEINSWKYANCLTGVQKDSLIIEVCNERSKKT